MRKIGGQSACAPTWFGLLAAAVGFLPLICAGDTAPDALAAALASDLPKLTAALETQPAAANAVDSHGVPILQLAIAGHSEPGVKLLLAHGADPDARGLNGDTGLHTAVRNGEPKILSLVAARTKFPDLPNDAGETALTLAIRKNDLAAVQQLLAVQADPNCMDNGFRHLPVALAIAWCQKDRNCRVLRALLAAGAVVQPPVGISGGIDGLVPLQTDTDQNLLQLAVTQGTREQVELLLDHGVRVDTEMSDLLFQLAMFTEHGGTAEVLLRHGGSATSFDSVTSPMLHRAAYMQEPGLIAAMLARGAMADGHDRAGSTAIQYVRDPQSAALLAAAMHGDLTAEFRSALEGKNEFAARALQPYVRGLPPPLLPLVWLAGMFVTVGWLYRLHRRETTSARLANAGTEPKPGSNRQPAVAVEPPGAAGSEPAPAPLAPPAADPLLPAPVTAATSAAEAGASTRSRPLLSQWLRDKRQGTAAELFQRFSAPRKLLVGAGAAWFWSCPLYFTEPYLLAQSPWVPVTTVLLGLGWLGVIAAMLGLRTPQVRYRGGMLAGYGGQLWAAGCAGWSIQWAAGLEAIGALAPAWLAYATAAAMIAMLPVLGYMLATMHKTHALSAPKKIRPSILTADDFDVPAGWDIGKKG